MDRTDTVGRVWKVPFGFGFHCASDTVSLARMSLGSMALPREEETQPNTVDRSHRGTRKADLSIDPRQLVVLVTVS
jgi:hypothetical protein